MVQNRKGARRERELVNLLDERGYGVMRAPASGAGTTRELPDVLVGNGTTFYAIEAKSSGGRPIYIEQEEVEALKFFCWAFGADARIGARFDREDWVFFDPDELYTTDGGNYRVKQEDIEDGIPLENLFESPNHEDLPENLETIDLDRVPDDED